MTLRAGLAEAFRAYEQALAAGDTATRDRLDAPGPETLSGDASGLLVGHEAVSTSRRAHKAAPRTIVQTHVREIDEAHALVVAVTEPVTGGRGQQTQLWAHRDGVWVVTATHVSDTPTALDTRTWRVVGDPLVPPTGSGALDGETVAVKDLFAVAGQRVGAGNPTWLHGAAVEAEHAWVVRQLLVNGAALRGIARTDELAFSLAGTNAHHGTPPNPRAPGRISGGSSSGPASAVSMGHATIGLGSDTSGSIRVPAAYQGLWGIRTTHGAVPVDGLLPLSPSFDVVGWLARGPELLASVGRLLLTGPATGVGEVVTVPEITAGADPEVAAAVSSLGGTPIAWPTALLPGWLEAYRTLQGWEAWKSHGAWVTDHPGALGDDVGARFAWASTITVEAAAEASAEVATARGTIRSLLGDRALLLPSASSVAPPVDDPAGFDAVRLATMRLTCIASLAGLPAVSIPRTTATGLPAGACLVGPACSDLALVALAATLVGD